jgi:glycosyltransferase involved in cell wall biosynthesis
MRIAQIAPIIERVPPKRYGGTERVVHALTEELVRRGHEVTLFASGDSLTSAALSSVVPRGIREENFKDLYGMNYWTMLQIGVAYHQQNKFDIIHDHMVPLSLPTANMSHTPVVGTMHGAFDPDARKLFECLRSPNIATISRSQAVSAPDIHHAGTVYNGLQMDNYPFSEFTDGYLLFVGRISPEKGTHIALQAAQQLDMPLIIAAKLEKTDEIYFHENVAPYLSERIKWIGEVSESARNHLMSRARAFLHPAMWHEPFGLTLIEAMACGCPVIAYNRGSIPEIVQSGVTGYVVNDFEGMLEAIVNIGTVDRTLTRDYARTTFNEKNMADGYEALYQTALTQNVTTFDESTRFAAPRLLTS